MFANKKIKRVYSAVCLLVVLICLSLSFFLIDETESFESGKAYFETAQKAKECNLYLSSLSFDEVLTPQLRIESGVLSHSDFDVERYDLLKAFAVENDKIVASVLSAVERLRGQEISTQLEEEVVSLLEKAGHFSLLEQEFLNNTLNEVIAIKEQKENLKNEIAFLLKNYCSKDILKIDAILSEISQINAFDRLDFQNDELLLNQLKEEIWFLQGKIENIKDFYEALQKENIEDIDPSDLQAIYFYLDRFETLPLKDQEDLEYIGSYLREVLNALTRNFFSFFKKDSKNS